MGFVDNEKKEYIVSSVLSFKVPLIKQLECDCGTFIFFPQALMCSIVEDRMSENLPSAASASLLVRSV